MIEDNAIAQGKRGRAVERRGPPGGHPQAVKRGGGGQGAERVGADLDGGFLVDNTQ
jgi:hypothetical protein